MKKAIQLENVQDALQIVIIVITMLKFVLVATTIMDLLEKMALVQVSVQNAQDNAMNVHIQITVQIVMTAHLWLKMNMVNQQENVEVVQVIVKNAMI